MYCQECGMKLSESAKFCSNCGTKVYVMPLQSEELSEEVQDELSTAEANLLVKKLKKDNKKSKKKLLGMIAGVLVMLAVVVGGFFAYLENRTLYTLVNPELFFGEYTTSIIMKDTPGESGVVLFFESDTHMWDEIIRYVNVIEQIDPNLRAFNDNDPRADASQGTAYSDTWHYCGNAFWSGYSLMDSKRVVTLKHFEENGKYVVEMYIEGYQNCEFDDVNPYTGQKANSKENTSTSDSTEHREQPTMTPSPKPTKTPAPVPTKAAELVAQEINTATAVQPPKNAFQDFATWGKGAVTTKDAEQRGEDIQYLDYEASQETIDAYIEMLQQNGFTLVDDYFFQYQSDPFASWALNCDYVPDAGKVEMQYESTTTCHLCISTADAGEYTFHYSSDITQYDLGLRMDGSVESMSVKGDSAGAGLYRSADGVYTTTDGRLSASMNKATVIRDGKSYICDARSEIKNKREWLWVEGYYRNEAICFELPQYHTMAGDLYQIQDVKREKYYHDTDGKSVYNYTWGNQPLFVMSVNDLFIGPLVTEKNKFEEVTVRVMYYEEGVEAVYYIYAKTSGTPSEIEVLCAVGLQEDEAENDEENAIVLSVGETHTLTYYANVFGAKSEVYSWSISGGDGIYADGTGSYCTVTAMKKGTGKVTVTCIYTVEVADILTGFPTTEQRSKSKTWYFRVE